MATIRSFGGRFDGDEEVASQAALSAPKNDGRHSAASHTDRSQQNAQYGAPRAASAPIPDTTTPAPPPPLADEPVFSSGPGPVTSNGLIADAFVSPEFVERPSAVAPAVSLTIDEKWRGGDDAIRNLANLGRIDTLRLHGAPLSDASLESIGRLSQLHTLRIEGGCFSQQAIQHLRQRQPQVQVIVSDK